MDDITRWRTEVARLQAHLPTAAAEVARLLQARKPLLLAGAAAAAGQLPALAAARQHEEDLRLTLEAAQEQLKAAEHAAAMWATELLQDRLRQLAAARLLAAGKVDNALRALDEALAELHSTGTALRALAPRPVQPAAALHRLHRATPTAVRAAYDVALSNRLYPPAALAVLEAEAMEHAIAQTAKREQVA